MLAEWTRWLPMPIIKWLARRHCERFDWMGTTVVSAYKDVYIRL